MGGGGSKDFLESKQLCKAAIRGADTVADKEEKVLAAFQAWDKDGNGKISKDEVIDLFSTLNPDIKKKDIEKLIKAADKDKDGAISFQEMTGLIFRAPHLEDYMKESKKILEKHVKEATNTSMKIMNNCGGNPFAAMGKLGAAMEKLKQKQQAEIDTKLAPILTKSFAWHDKDNSGVLEYDEGILFFSNYAGMLPEYYKDITKMAVIQSTKTMQAQLKKAMGSAAAKEMGTAMEAALEQQMAMLDEVLEAKRADYIANVDERHKAAWAVLDVNGDGKLQQTEVFEALLHGHSKNQAFAEALGLFVQQTDMQGGGGGGFQMQMNMGGGGDGEECAQQ